MAIVHVKIATSNRIPTTRSTGVLSELIGQTTRRIVNGNKTMMIKPVYIGSANSVPNTMEMASLKFMMSPILTTVGLRRNYHMITFESVTKTYPGSTRGAPEVVAVQDTTFTIDSRTIMVLAGSSGCGKTTLLRMVNRMVTPTSGTIRIDGDDIGTMNPVKLRRSIGYVMQNAGLLPHKTVAENIAVVPQLNGATKAAARQAVGRMLELVELPSQMADRYPAA